MQYATGQPIGINQIIRELRVMADQHGAITSRRAAIIMQAADRLEELDERVAIMQEGSHLLTWERIPEESSGIGSRRPD